MLHLDWQELAREGENAYSTFFSRGSALSIGSFDGLHKGHCALLKRLMKKGRELNLPCGVLTFSSPPRYLFSSSSPSCISTLRLKLENLEKMGLDFVILVDFSLNFAKMGGEYFVGLLKRYVNLKYLLVGEDFRFGSERSSSIEDMRDFSSKFFFSFEAFSSICGFCNEAKVSSSLIRKAIHEGDFLYISSFLQDGLDIDLLNAKPYEVGDKWFSFLREDLQQILPKDGEFLGVLRFLDGKEKEVKVLFDTQCVKLILNETVFTGHECGNDEFNEEVPHFNILKLKEKI